MVLKLAILGFDQIKFVVFDFDDTLVDEEYWIQSRWHKTLMTFSHISERDLLWDVFSRIYKAKGKNYKYHVDDTLLELKIDKKWKQPIIECFLQTRGIEKLITGAKELLELLKILNYRTGIITNGLKKTHEYRVNLSQIRKFIDFIIYGDSVKKPDPMIFNHFFSIAGVNSPSEMLYIGNDFNEDINSARSLKINTIWLTNSNEKCDDEFVHTSQSYLEIKDYFIFRKKIL